VFWDTTSCRKAALTRLTFFCLAGVSYNQTVENLFTLSFLVRDGRAQLNQSLQGLEVGACRATVCPSPRLAAH
jgi:hypothetical protein